MDYNNEMKRLEGHEPMKEIPESFEEYKPVAAAGRRTRRKGVAMAGAHGGGFNTGAIIAGIGAVVLAGLVFWFSDACYFRNGSKDTARNGQIAAVAGQQPSGVIEVTEITTGEIAQSMPETDSAELSSASVSAATSVKAVPQTLAQASAAGDTVSSGATLQGAATPDVVCLFPVNGDVIQENPQLNDLAEEVVADGSDVVITGYTDESGNAAYNQQLSDRRAKAIGDYLVAHGVPRDHISVEGRGQTHAFASNALDRRVEVRVV